VGCENTDGTRVAAGDRVDARRGRLASRDRWRVKTRRQYQPGLADATAGFRASTFLFSAQCFFSAAEMRFLAAAVIPRFVTAEVAVVVAVALGLPDDVDLRAAHRACIASDRRRLPAEVIPLPRLGAADPTVIRRVGLAVPSPSARASIALSNRSRSCFSSETILSRFNCGLLSEFLLYHIYRVLVLTTTLGPATHAGLLPSAAMFHG
jgi:hypothetical protein